MQAKRPTRLPPPLPAAPARCWWRSVLRVTGGILLGYAIILATVTALIVPLGGPIEPPSNMAWEEFVRWTDGGAWCKNTVGTCIIVAGIGVTLMFIGRRTRLSDVPAGTPRHIVDPRS
jgi:hypothetical protein